MNRYHLATHLLAFVASVGLVLYAIWGPMTWWMALGGTFAINLVATSYTRDETPHDGS
jgi:hypothetical protein